MNSELQKWYKALEEADRKAEAGDEQAKKDAYEIADTIRQLEAQGQGGDYEAKLTTPVVIGGATALPAVGGAAVRMIQAAATPPAAKAPAASAPAVTGGLTQEDIDLQRTGTLGPGGSGRARNTTYNVQTAEMAEMSNEQKAILKQLQEKGIIDKPKISRIAGSTPAGVVVTDPDALIGYGQTTPPKLTAAQRASMALSRAPAATLQGIKNLPGAAVRGAANVPGGRIASGYSVGALGAETYNYNELAKEAESRGDTAAANYYKAMALVSGAGTAAGGIGAVSKTPRGRALALPAAGLAAYNYLQSQRGYPAPGQDASAPAVPSVSQTIAGRAEGGAIKGYQKGKKVGEAVKGGLDLIVGRGPVIKPAAIQTVRDPRRMDFPGIYERPDIIAQRAVENTAPESPLLKQLFGVTRQDLYEMSKRKGNMPGVIPGAAKNPKGSAAAEAVMTPQNEQRILDIMSEIQTRAPGMYQGMHGWYVMDPEYQRLVQLVGKDEAGRLYRQLNVFGGIESPNMPVPNEFRRASAAHMLAEQGRFPEWKKYGGLRALEKSGMPDYPSDLLSVPGRVGHQRASGSQEKFLLTGHHGMDSPKAPPYIEASSVPELGFQTDIPVGDAHWSRGVGLADVRTGKSTAESVSTPEIQQLSPWWREKIAAEMGTESVPAQAVMWGGLGPYTGVKTAVGAPKLELHAIEIGDAAKRLNVSPETARDLILMGKERAGRREGGYIQ